MTYREKIKIIPNMGGPYLIWGPESYLIDDYIKRIKKYHVSEELETLNFTEFPDDSFDFENLLNACETLPFMSEKKVIIVYSQEIFKPLTQVDSKTKNSIEVLRNYLKKISKDNILIFVQKHDDIKKNNGLYKDIQKYGSVFEMKKLNNIDFQSWVKNSLLKTSVKISNSDLHYLLEKTGYLDRELDKNLYDVENELKKIINYVKTTGVIKREDIDELMTESLELNIFKLLDNISKRNCKEAMNIYTEMYLGGKPVLFILHMITRQFRNLLNIKLLKQKGYSDNAIRKKTFLSVFEYNKLLREIDKFTVDNLENYLNLALEADKNIKTGMYSDRVSIEVLIAKLCSI